MGGSSSNIIKHQPFFEIYKRIGILPEGMTIAHAPDGGLAVLLVLRSCGSPLVERRPYVFLGSCSPLKHTSLCRLQLGIWVLGFDSGWVPIYLQHDWDMMDFLDSPVLPIYYIYLSCIRTGVFVFNCLFTRQLHGGLVRRPWFGSPSCWTTPALTRVISMLVDWFLFFCR